MRFQKLPAFPGHRTWALALAWLGLLIAAAQAQDRLTFRDKHVEEGKVVGMNNGAVVINVAAGQLNYNLALLSRVEVAPPAALTAANAAYEAGDWDRALAGLKPIVDAFKGLPVDWARQATAALGDVYLEKDDLGRALAAYNDLRTLYPAGAGNSLRLSLAQARIAFAQNNFPAAEQQLTPIRDAALAHPAEATRADGAVYGRALYLLGQLEERRGDYQAALQDYLRTVTLFYEDAAATARAQKSADALRAAHNDVSVP